MALKSRSTRIPLRISPSTSLSTSPSTSLKTSPSTSLRTSLGLLLFALAAICLNANPVSAVGSAINLPGFAEFSRNIQNGQKDVLRGVYAENVLALPVVQQPSGKTVYVSNNDGEVTQFGMASNFGNIGLLAHNNLAGQFFSQLKPGQEILLIYGDGHVESFIVEKVLKFQALQPNNPYSTFKNLDRDETLTAGEMFNRVYMGNHHLTFQTCIAADGKSSWGRLFVLAVPRENAQGAHRRSS